jgi:putative ABC transport system permease protein
MTWSKNRGERLKDEIEAHIDFETRENIEAGMPPEEARHAAMRKFGNVLLVRERSREIWGWI